MLRSEMEEKKKCELFCVEFVDEYGSRISSDQTIKTIAKVKNASSRSRHAKRKEERDGFKMANPLSSRSAQIAFAQGHVFNDMCAAMWFNYLLVYLQFVVQFNAEIAGAALLIGQVVDGLVCPIVGVVSDKGKTGIFNYGRRKTAHIIGTLLVLLSFPFVFMPVPGVFRHQSQGMQLLYYSVFIALFQIGWATVQIAHLAIITDLTSDVEQRTWLMSLRNIFTVMAISAVYIIAFCILEYCPQLQMGWLSHYYSLNSLTSEPGTNTIGPNCAMQFIIIIGVITVIGIFETLWYHVVVKEVSSDGELSQNLIASSERSASPWLLFTRLKFYSVTLVYVAARLFFNLLQSFIPLYLLETLNLPQGHIFIIPFVIHVNNFASSLAVTKLNVYLGRKVTFYIGCLLGILAGVIVVLENFGDLYRYYLIFIVSIIIGISTGILTITALSLITDMIGEDANNGAFVYGFMSLIEKCVNGGGAAIIQGFKPTAAVPKAIYTKNAVGACCFVSCFLGIFAMYITPSSVVSLSYRSESMNNEVSVNKRQASSLDPEASGRKYISDSNSNDDSDISSDTIPNDVPHHD